MEDPVNRNIQHRNSNRIYGVDMFKQPSVGQLELSEISVDGKKLWTVSAPNTVVYTGVDLMARMLTWEDIRINAAYLEFVPNGETPPSVAADPEDGRNYYADLEVAVGPQSDYLRVPIVTPPYTESTDDTKFEGNKVVFTAFSSGETGVGGKVFGEGAQIYGLALVHAPDMDDRTQDIVFARSYSFSPREKTALSQIMLRWTHTVGEVTPAVGDIDGGGS